MKMARNKTSWKEMLERELGNRGETLSDLESITLNEEEMNMDFDAGYGCIEGTPFTAWTAKTVYFPICYDGAEAVGSVSRHPDGKPTNHQGGG